MQPDWSTLTINTQSVEPTAVVYDQIPEYQVVGVFEEMSVCFHSSDLVVNAVVVVHLQLLDALHSAALHDVSRHLIRLLSLRLRLGLAGLKQNTTVEACYKPPRVATQNKYTYRSL